MSWIDGDIAPRMEEGFSPKPKMTLPTDDFHRRLLNLEATVTNLKHTILKLCGELESLKWGKQLQKPDRPLNETIQPYLEEFYKTKVMPEMLHTCSSMQEKVEKMEEALKSKSPFEVKVLDY